MTRRRIGAREQQGPTRGYMGQRMRSSKERSGEGRRMETGGRSRSSPHAITCTCQLITSRMWDGGQLADSARRKPPCGQCAAITIECEGALVVTPSALPFIDTAVFALTSDLFRCSAFVRPRCLCQHPRPAPAVPVLARLPARPLGFRARAVIRLARRRCLFFPSPTANQTRRRAALS